MPLLQACPACFNVKRHGRTENNSDLAGESAPVWHVR
jgi:hypothetical protein